MYRLLASLILVAILAALALIFLKKPGQNYGGTETRSDDTFRSLKTQ